MSTIKYPTEQMHRKLTEAQITEVLQAVKILLGTHVLSYMCSALCCSGGGSRSSWPHLEHFHA